MCTVTFVPVKNGALITSNRDEKHVRKLAIPPQAYKHNEGYLIYPKDADAGGTWVAMKDNGNAAVLLNGGFIKHTYQPPYRRSRGLIFLDIVGDETPVGAFSVIALDNIEPFTLIVYNGNSLVECRWDGNKKHIKQLPVNVAHIWASVTLYDETVITKREQWFNKWLQKNPIPTVESILNFHHFGGDGDVYNDIRMNRNGIYYTVSITAMQLKNSGCSMHYLDLKNNRSFIQQIDVSSAVAV